MSRKNRKSPPYTGILTRPMTQQITRVEFYRRWSALCCHYQLDPRSPTTNTELLTHLIRDHVPGFSIMRAPGRPRGPNAALALFFNYVRRTQPSWSKAQTLDFIASLRILKHQDKRRRGQPKNSEAIRAMLKRGSSIVKKWTS